jgi:hypothetical protein
VGNWDLENDIDFGPAFVPPGEALAGTMCALFRAAENDFAVALVANSAHILDEWSNSKGPFFKWRIVAPPKLFVEYKRQVHFALNDFGELSSWHEDDFLALAWDLGKVALKRAGLRELKDIVVEPATENDPGWRRNAQDYLTGQGVNNQGNVYTTNRPRIVHDELFFRTQSEANVHDALLRRRIPFMPLPVVMRADGSKRPDTMNRRIEPDFVMLYKGKMVVVEIDGGSHAETPVAAHERVKFLVEAGALVERIDTDRCKDTEGAALVVADLLKTLDRRIDAA